MNESIKRDTQEARLIRIERKLDVFGEMVSGAIGLSGGYAAYYIVTVDWNLGSWLGVIAAVVVCGFIGSWVWRGYREGR